MLPIPHYYIGLDLGQRAGFSAFAAVEYRPGALPHFLSPWSIPANIYELRHLHRVSLGTPYTEVVPKRDLISNLELMFERGELRTADQLPNRARLVEELMNMKSKPTKAGNEVMGAEGKHHDDLVLAVALAAWAARKAAM